MKWFLFFFRRIIMRDTLSKTFCWHRKHFENILNFENSPLQPLSEGSGRLLVVKAAGTKSIVGHTTECDDKSGQRQQTTTQQPTNDMNSKGLMLAGEETPWGQRSTIGGKSGLWQEHWRSHKSVWWQKQVAAADNNATTNQRWEWQRESSGWWWDRLRAAMQQPTGWAGGNGTSRGGNTFRGLEAAHLQAMRLPAGVNKCIKRQWHDERQCSPGKQVVNGRWRQRFIERQQCFESRKDGRGMCHNKMRCDNQPVLKH